MTSSESLLAAHSITVVRSDEQGLPIKVLKNVSLKVANGELLALVGPSGSGKSTLLRVLNRLLEPESGQVMYANQDIKSIAPPELRSQLSLVPQKPFLLQGTVKYNLEASARLRSVTPPDFSSFEIKNLLNDCQIEPGWLEKDARKLSVGQQQRVCLARVLMGPCKILLLDEPTSALDRPTADLLAMTFKKLCQERGLAILMVTHDIRIAQSCADKVAVILNGEIVETGPSHIVLHDPATTAARQFLKTELSEGLRGES